MPLRKNLAKSRSPRTIFRLCFCCCGGNAIQKGHTRFHAMAVSALWWPGALGFFAIIVGGLVAWIGQARLSNVIPGARGERAVSAIFGLVALGACAYFVAPLMLLEGTLGFETIVPLVLVSVSLAALFGFAARTGPPVPHYFMIGPLLLAPMAGGCLFMALPEYLWAMVGLSGILCFVAWVRHRVKLSHGTEELDPSPEDAAKADQEILIKLGNKFRKKH